MTAFIVTPLKFDRFMGSKEPQVEHYPRKECIDYQWFTNLKLEDHIFDGTVRILMESCKQ